jgi:hypothetical protein
MLVDRDQPAGERYDAAVAAQLFGEMVDAVATSAAPALA